MINKRFMKGILILTVLFALAIPCSGNVYGKDTVQNPVTVEEMLAEARQHIEEVTVDQAKAEFDSGEAIFLDVRTLKEYKRGYIPNAQHLERGLLEFKIADKIPDKSARIIVYCKSGGRGCLATDTLKRMGYTNVANMIGGWTAWVKAGYPIE